MGVPGVTFERVDLNRPRVARLRTDICAFLGYAERGPIDRPVKLQSWRQFLDAYGPPLPFAHTGHAVRLYFENGGDACCMMRVSDPAMARTASLRLGDAVTLSAAFSAIARAETNATGPTSEPAAAASASPGAWGNRLSVTVERGGLGTTRSLPNQPADGASLRVEAIAGFGVGSWVRLIQDGGVRDSYALIAESDPQLREFTWAAPLAGLGLDFARPVQLETVEFTLRVALDGEEIARHRDLSLDPRHPRRVDHVLARESPLISARIHVDPSALANPALWPTPGLPQRLSGGRDGIATVTRRTFLDALAQYETIDEVSILAAPDLVLRAEPLVEDQAPPLPTDRCKSPEAPPAGTLGGLVLEAGDGSPLVGVRVTSRDVATRAAITGVDGRFTLSGLPVGQVAVRLQKAGFVTLDASAQAFLVALDTPQRFEMSRRTLPPALVADDIFEVQQAMVAQGERGLYRVALLDPPEEMLGVEEIQSWRSRFDTSFAALYWPWLMVTPPGEMLRAVPPSGAVAGLIARMDIAEGPQRAPANRQLRNVEALSLPVDDATHGMLNGLGINVLRATPGHGIAPQGARTLGSDPQWRYLGVRRLVLMIAEAIEDGHQWAVFEPNDRVLRDALTHSLTAFLDSLFKRGAFAGATREAAFAVKCDEENNPPEVIDAGQVVAQIAIAPVRPYEFIRLRLGRTDRLMVQE
jgi:hypothetical protein